MQHVDNVGEQRNELSVVSFVQQCGSNSGVLPQSSNSSAALLKNAVGCGRLMQHTDALSLSPVEDNTLLQLVTYDGKQMNRGTSLLLGFDAQKCGSINGASPQSSSDSTALMQIVVDLSAPLQHKASPLLSPLLGAENLVSGESLVSPLLPLRQER